MSIDQYRMVHAVAETGGLKAASEKLHKTQPAISQGIKQLESLLGISVFDRQGYRLKLTSEGKTLYLQMQRVLAEEDKLRQLAQYLKGGHEAQVVLAINASFPMEPILPILQLAQQRFKQTQIVLNQEYISGAMQRLQDSQAHLAITPTNSATIQSNLYELSDLPAQSLVNVAVPSMQPADGQEQSMLEHYQVVVKDTGSATGDKDIGVQDGQRRWYVNDFQTKKDFLVRGMGWGRLPGHLIVKELEEGVLKPLQLDQVEATVEVPFHLVRQRKLRHGPVAEYLWQALSKLS